MRLGYRARQFWQALTASPSPDDLERVRLLLTAPQVSLFEQLSPSEQAHAIRVMNWLRENGEEHPDLLASALLHDVGKSIYPLSAWERVLGVVCKKICPSQAERWGEGDLEVRSWKRMWLKPFVVASQHPLWSAEMVAQSGSSQLVIHLIRNHQNHSSSRTVTLEDAMLIKLQTADRNN